MRCLPSISVLSSILALTGFLPIRLSGQAPDASPDPAVAGGVTLAQIEVSINGAHLPVHAGASSAVPAFVVHSGTASSGLESSHATAVADRFYGPDRVPDLAVTRVHLWEAWDYVFRSAGYFSGTEPPPAAWEVENHSWVGWYAFRPEELLRRIDYRVQRDNVLVVAGIDNGSNTRISPFLGNLYNGLVVGSRTGHHARGGSTTDGRGRLKPDLVATDEATSFAAPVVSRAGAHLIGLIRSDPALAEARPVEVIKALLLAGTSRDNLPGWTQTHDQTLDPIFGAGELDLARSVAILNAGCRPPMTDSAGGADGWDFGQTTGPDPVLYPFTITPGQTGSLSIALCWHRFITADESFSQYQTRLENLDLTVYRFDDANGAPTVVAESRSALDNVEYLHLNSLPAGTYALAVNGESADTPFGLAWRFDPAPPTDPATGPAPVPPPTPIEVPPEEPPVPSGDRVFRGSLIEADLQATAYPIGLLPGSPTDGFFAAHLGRDGFLTVAGGRAEGGLHFHGRSTQPVVEGDFHLDLATSRPNSHPAVLEGTLAGSDLRASVATLGLQVEARLATTLEDPPETTPLAGVFTIWGLPSYHTTFLLMVGPKGEGYLAPTGDPSKFGGPVTVNAQGEVRSLLPDLFECELRIGSASGRVTGWLSPSADPPIELLGLGDGVASTTCLVNLSARGRVPAAGGAIIAGFVLEPGAPSRVLIRAAGPTLGQFGVTHPIRSPELRLATEPESTVTDLHWSGPNGGPEVAAAASRVGASPWAPGSEDEALLGSLSSGRYSAVVRDRAGTSGIGLVEIYREEVLPSGRLANLSIRGRVEPGNRLIAGFVVEGNGPIGVLIRGVGPGLAVFGIHETLTDPELVLTRHANGVSTTVSRNADWRSGPEPTALAEASERVGAFPLDPDDPDAALLLRLAPGVYTAELSSQGDESAGSALVEVYPVPESRP